MSLTVLGWDQYLRPTKTSSLLPILATSGATIGVSLGLIALATSIFLQRTCTQKRAALATFLAAVVNLIALLGFCAIQILFVRKHALTEAIHLFSGRARSPGPSSTFGLRESRVVLEQLMTVLSDLVVIGRAKAMYPDQRWVGLALIVLWVISVGWGIALDALLSVYRVDVVQRWSLLNAVTYIFAGCSGILNLLATSLIAFQLWSYRRFLKKEVGIRRPRYTRVQRVLRIVVESGCIYRFTQISFFIFGLIAGFSRARFSEQVANAMPIVQQVFYVISGIYPVSLYLILNIQSRREDEFSLIDLGGESRSYS